MSPYRETPERELPTWWQGFRGGFGRWIGSAAAFTGVGMTILVTIAVLESRAERTECTEVEMVAEEKLVQERKLCEQQLAEKHETYLDALKYQQELARLRAVCHCSGGVYHEGKCFSAELIP